MKLRNSHEPRHDKTNKMCVRPAKTQISLGIRPVWSQSSLSAWRKLGSLATHQVHSKDSDQTGRMPRLIRVFAGYTITLLVLSCCGSHGYNEQNHLQVISNASAQSRKIHKQKPQPTPTPGGRENVTLINVCIANKQMPISTKTSSLCPKQSDQNAKRTEETHRQRAGHDQTWSSS